MSSAEAALGLVSIGNFPIVSESASFDLKQVGLLSSSGVEPRTDDNTGLESHEIVVETENIDIEAFQQQLTSSIVSSGSQSPLATAHADDQQQQYVMYYKTSQE
jgi:hypothetical protein